MITPTVKKWLH